MKLLSRLWLPVRQLFCNHIWQDGENLYLRTEKQQYDYNDDVTNVYLNIDYYAISQRCIKCNQNRYIEKRKVTVQESRCKDSNPVT